MRADIERKEWRVKGRMRENNEKISLTTPNFPSSKNPKTSLINSIQSHYFSSSQNNPKTYPPLQKAPTQFSVCKNAPTNCDNHNSASSLHTHCSNRENRWIFDCGATDTMTFELADITKPSIPSRTHVQTANGALTAVKGAGTINITPTLQLPNCLYVPSLSHKLLSVSHVTRALNCAMIIHPSFCYLQDTRTGEIIGHGTEQNGLYYVDEIAHTSKALFSRTTSDEEAWLWHRRLGHPSAEILIRNRIVKEMGKATRWLKGLLGMKKDKENVDRNPICEEKREKKRWSFAKAKDSGPLNQIPVNIPSDDSAWLRSFIVETEKDQNEHAMAVAAATAAAADAAVAAAQAAVAVVRLTSQGKGGHYTGGREIWASVKIQTVFRGFLARKALRALKGLVKLQALVRGFLVRKRAAATLHSMQALFRAQVAVRTERARRSISNEARFRRPHQRIDEFNSRRLSSSYDPSTDESPKIVEIDTYGPKSRSRRINTCMTEYEDDQYYQAVSSPLPCPVQVPARLSTPDRCHLQDFDWGFVTEDYKFPTAQNTPRFSYSGRANVPVTPVKSVCGDGLFRPYSYHPSYMANTQSFRAKVRSYSAPKQRPEAGPKKGLSLNEMMAARSSFSGVGMQRTSQQVREDFEI